MSFENEALFRNFGDFSYSETEQISKENKSKSDSEKEHKPKSSSIKIFIEDINGEYLPLKMKREDSVKLLKEAYIEKKDDLAKSKSRIMLSFQGKILNEELTLKECHIGEGDIIHPLIRMKEK